MPLLNLYCNCAAKATTQFAYLGMKIAGKEMLSSVFVLLAFFLRNKETIYVSDWIGFSYLCTDIHSILALS